MLDKALRPAYQYVFFLDESAPTDESNSMQKKALQAAGEVFLAIALMHASLRLRYLIPSLRNTYASCRGPLTFCCVPLRRMHKYSREMVSHVRFAPTSAT